MSYLIVASLFSLEEQERRERERARRLAGLGQAGEGLDGEGEPPPPRFSLAQIILGSTGFLIALTTLILKSIDNNTAHAILDKVGLGHLIPKIEHGRCYKPTKRVSLMLNQLGIIIHWFR